MRIVARICTGQDGHFVVSTGNGKAGNERETSVGDVTRGSGDCNPEVAAAVRQIDASGFDFDGVLHPLRAARLVNGGTCPCETVSPVVVADLDDMLAGRTDNPPRRQRTRLPLGDVEVQGFGNVVLVFYRGNSKYDLVRACRQGDILVDELEGTGRAADAHGGIAAVDVVAAIEIQGHDRFLRERRHNGEGDRGRPAFPDFRSLFRKENHRVRNRQGLCNIANRTPAQIPREAP